MLRIILISLLSILFIFPAITVGYAADSNITARAFVLMDVTTGRVLLSRNAHEVRPPASTTKIMTAILALEQGNVEREVSVSPKAAAVGEASIYLEPYEKISVINLVKGALIKSGNDAAVAIAEAVGGSEDLFATLMNRKAKIIGAVETNFKNPNGLPEENHTTTAYDLAVMARYGLQNDVFRDVVATKELSIPWEGKSWDRYLKNTNKLLWNYPGADGVKTGTTREAGGCLVASATREGRQLIAVLLKSNNRFNEAAALLNFGFRNTKLEIIPENFEFGAVYIPQAKDYRVPLVTAQKLTFTIPVHTNLERKVVIQNFNEKNLQGKEVGQLLLEMEGKELARIPLVTKGK